MKTVSQCQNRAGFCHIPVTIPFYKYLMLLSQLSSMYMLLFLSCFYLLRITVAVCSCLGGIVDEKLKSDLRREIANKSISESKEQLSQSCW